MFDEWFSYSREDPIGFLCNESRDKKGRLLNDYYKFSDAQIDSDKYFFDRMFPLCEEGIEDKKAPICQRNAAECVHCDTTITMNMNRSYKFICDYYLLLKEYCGYADYSKLCSRSSKAPARIIRMLKSLRMFGMYDLVRELVDVLGFIENRGFIPKFIYSEMLNASRF
jgi:hypothetical protein